MHSQEKCFGLDSKLVFSLFLSLQLLLLSGRLGKTEQVCVGCGKVASAPRALTAIQTSSVIFPGIIYSSRVPRVLWNVHVLCRVRDCESFLLWREQLKSSSELGSIKEEVKRRVLILTVEAS